MIARIVLSLSAAVVVVAVTWWSGDAALPPVDGAVGKGPTGRSAVLAMVRRDPSGAALDAFVAEQEELSRREPPDGAQLRVLAEARLECLLSRDSLRGMRIGSPTHDELPQRHRDDIDAGLRELERAAELGDDSSDLHRIRAGLLSAQIVSQWSALRLRGEIQAALDKARERDPGNPRVLVALACERLFTPGWLGGDPRAALELLLRAAPALEIDERPLVFAAMAAELCGERDRARELLDHALARNPDNRYARTVRARLERGEDDAFSRDVDAPDAERER